MTPHTPKPFFLNNLSQLLPLQESEVFPPSSSNLLYEQIILKDKKKGFRCLFPRCERTSRFKSDMKRHTLIHTKDRPYICSICKKDYKRADALKAHMETHDENAIFYCTEEGCKAKFQKATALSYHLLKHNNKRFICNFEGCRKSFFAGSYLKQHKKIHDHQKLTLQNPNQNDANDVTNFFNSFEDPIQTQDKTFLPSVKENLFEENFTSQKPEKFLHIEEGAVVNNTETIELNQALNPSDSQESSKLSFEDFFQLMICKHLLQDNQKMRAKLEIKTDSIKEKFENRLLARLNKSLSFQFDLKNFINSYILSENIEDKIVSDELG